MRALFIFVILAMSCCVQAQNSNRGKVFTHMAEVRKFLAKGDTVSAIKEYRMILEITPNDENIKQRIAELSVGRENALTEPLPVKKDEPSASVKENPVLEPSVVSTPVNEERPNRDAEEAAIVKPVVDETPIVVDDAEGTDDVIQENVVSSGFGGFGNFKRNQGTNSSKKDSTAPKPKKLAEAKPAFDVTKDMLAKAFVGNSRYGNDLFRFTSLPTDPFDSLLVAESKKAPAPNLSGRWISSFRSNDIYAGVMLMLEIDSTSNKPVLVDTQSRLKRICDEKGYDIQLKQSKKLQNQVFIGCTVDYDAPNYNKVKTFVNDVFKPFINEYNVNNVEAQKLMTVGVLKQKIVVKETVRYDTAMVMVGKKEVPEITEVILRDTTVTPYYKLDSLFKVHCNITINTVYSKNVLHGSCKFEAFVDYSEGRIPVMSAMIPCNFYKVGDNYDDVYNVSETINAAKNDTINAEDLANENNMGYFKLNGIGGDKDYAAALAHFEKAAKNKVPEAYSNLYIMYSEGLGVLVNMDKAYEFLALGREKTSPTALSLSADLMVAAPCGDQQQAYKWFERAADKKDAYAMMRLAQMKQRGEGCSKDPDGAVELFERSWVSECFDAGYELSLILLERDSKTKAYSRTIESASNGSIKAMKLISDMYFMGIGVRPNPSKAISWLKKMQKAISQQTIGYKIDK